MYGGFCHAAKKKGHSNEVAIRRGSTVSHWSCIIFNCHLISSVGRVPVCWAGGRGFKPRPDQHLGSFFRRKCCLCDVICKWLDFLVFSDKDEKPWVLFHSTFTDLFLWDVKEPTLLFEKSKGQRPRWCGQPLWVVGLGRDGTLHGTYESCSCLFRLDRPVSRKACKTKQ